jgi:hypothetical protein
VKFGGSTQGLAGVGAATVLLGVMDEGDGEMMPALQFAQVGGEGRHLSRGVLVDPVQAEEGSGAGELARLWE